MIQLFLAGILVTVFSTMPSVMGYDVQSPGLIVYEIPHGLPVITNIDGLEAASRYDLNGTILDITPIILQGKPFQQDNQPLHVNEFSIKVENKFVQHANNIIKFVAFRYVSTDYVSKSSEPLHSFQSGQNVSVFLIKKEPDSGFTNSYAASIATKYNIADGLAYDVTSTKQNSPLYQLRSGIHSKDINCNEGLALLIKTSNGQPICVTPSTKTVLIDRDWAKPV